jgi:CelD/BcsL family acetyltransferase involved in cellulose biosynthesis
MLAGDWQKMTAAMIRDRGEIARLGAAWQRLAAASLEPSGLNAPEMILPILARHPGGELMTVGQAGELLLALPVSKRSLPLPHRTNLATPLTLMGLPHVDSELASSSIAEMLMALDRPLFLRSLPVDGPFFKTSSREAPRFSIIESWSRAALDVSGNFETWFETNFERKRRKEYRRLRARLGEEGKLESASLASDGDAAAWAAELLALEAAGWKGTRKTALAADPGMAFALADACRGLHAAGKLRFWKLELDGRPIAMMYAIIEGSNAWLCKIAYDEVYARFSPGVLLLLDATEALFNDSSVKFADSCAIPNHPMIDNIWRDRIEVADVLLAPKHVSAIRFKTTFLALSAERRARAATKSLLHRFSKRSVS